MATPMYRRAFDAAKTALKECRERLQDCVDADNLSPGEKNCRMTIEESRRLVGVIDEVLRLHPQVVMAGVLFVWDDESGDHKPLGDPFNREAQAAAEDVRKRNAKYLKRQNEKMIDRHAAKRRKQADLEVLDIDLGFPPPRTPTPT